MIYDVFHKAFAAGAHYKNTPEPVYCRNCATRLEVHYCGASLYSVKCWNCNSITLVKASNPIEAARFVGAEKKSGALISRDSLQRKVQSAIDKYDGYDPNEIRIIQGLMEADELIDREPSI